MNGRYIMDDLSNILGQLSELAVETEEEIKKDLEQSQEKMGLKTSSKIPNLPGIQVAKSRPPAIESDEAIKNLLKRSLPTIQIIGIGGAGNNCSARLLKSGLEKAEIIAVNTDAQDLLKTSAHKKALIGYSLTKGFGAGNNPKIGEKAALESVDELKSIITGNLVFITTGLGGGTGTGAAAVAAQLARDRGALAISICTLPFEMEGTVRRANAAEGLKKLYRSSDTVIVIPNQRLLSFSRDITLVKGFQIADAVLMRAVSSITELITKKQLVNLDFADIKKILKNGGISVITLGESHHSDRPEEAVDDALNSPLIADLDLKTSKKALICVTGGTDLSITYAERVVDDVRNRIDPEAEVIWGASIDENIKSDVVRCIIILSSMESDYSKKGAISRE